MAGKIARLHVAALLLFAVAGCSGEQQAALPASTLDAGSLLGCAVDEDQDGYGVGCRLGPDCNDLDADVHDDCSACEGEEAGCACEPGTKPASCFEQSLADDATLLCSHGMRYCRDGKWSACETLTQFEVDVAERRAANAQSELQSSGELGSAVQALVPDPPDSEPCSPCRPDCFPVTDELNPGGLSSQNSINVVDTASGGITVEFTEVKQTVTSTTTCIPNVCTMPGDDTVCDDDCDGIPNAYDLARDNKPFGTTATSIFMDLEIGEYEDATIDLAFYVRTADVYFLIDATSTMAEEITQLYTDMQTGTFLADDRECGDINRDGSTADEEVLKSQGIAGNIVCRLRDGYIGMGWFREIPFSAAGDVDEQVYQHVVDLKNDPTELRTFMSTVTTNANSDAPNAHMLALYTAATGNEAYLGWNRPAVPQRTTCTLGTWGYPCFRDAAFPIIVMVTDTPMHNGPRLSSLGADPSYPYAASDLTGTVNAGTSIGSPGEHHYLHPTQIRDSTQFDPLNGLPFDGNDLVTSAFDVGSINDVLVTYTGDTRGMKAEPEFESALQTCTGLTSVTGPDAFYKFTVDAAQELTVSTRGSSFPTVLGIFTTIPNPSSCTTDCIDWSQPLDMGDLTGDGDTEVASIPEPLPAGVNATLSDAMVSTAGSLPREATGNECYDGSSETNQGNSGNNSEDYGPDMVFHFNLSQDMDLSFWADDTGPNLSLSLYDALPQVPESIEVPNGTVTVTLPEPLNAWREDPDAPGAYRLVGPEDDGESPPDDLMTLGSQSAKTIAGAPFRNFKDDSNVSTCRSVANDLSKGIKVNFTLEEDPLDPTRTYDIAIETNGDGNGLDVQKATGNAQIYHAIGLTGQSTLTAPTTSIAASTSCEDQTTVCTVNAATDLGPTSDSGWAQISATFDSSPSFTPDIAGTWLDNTTTSGAASSCDGSAAGYDMAYKLVLDTARVLDIEASAPISYLSLHNSTFATATTLTATQNVSSIPSTPSLEAAITGVGADGADTDVVDVNVTGIGGTSGSYATKTIAVTTASQSSTVDTSIASAIDGKVITLTGDTGTGDKDIDDGDWTGCGDMGDNQTEDVLYRFTLNARSIVRLTSSSSTSSGTVAAIFDTSGNILSGCATRGSSVAKALSGGTYFVAISNTANGAKSKSYSLTLSAEDYWLYDSFSDRINSKYINFSGSTVNAAADISRGTFGNTCIGGATSTDARPDIVHLFRTTSATTVQIENADADLNFGAVASLFAVDGSGNLGALLTSTSGSTCMPEGTTSVFSLSSYSYYALVVSTTGPASGAGSTGAYSLRVRAPDPTTASEVYTLDVGDGESTIGAADTNHILLSGSTTGRISNVSLGCAGGPVTAQPDIVHVFSVPAEYDNIVRIKNTSSTADAYTSTAKLYNYSLSTGLGSAVAPVPSSSGGACIAEGATTNYRLRNTSTTTAAYYAIVVSNGSASSATTSGSYSLEVIAALGAESAEKYTLPAALDSRYVELQGSTSYRSADVSTFAASCTYATPNAKQSDVVHVFTLNAAATVTVENVAHGSSLNAVASLFAYSGSTLGALQTPTSGTSCIPENGSATYGALAAGTYAVVVSAANGTNSSSGYGGYDGAYTLRLRATSASLGEGAQLTGTSPTPSDRIDFKDVLITGSTNGRASGGVRRSNFSTGGSCVGGTLSTSTNADVVHTFTVGTTTTVRLALNGTLSFMPVAGLFTGASLGAATVSGTAVTPSSGDNCITAGESGSYTLTPGTYAIAVSSAVAGASGDYTIQLTAPDQDRTGGLVACSQGTTSTKLSNVSLAAGTYYIVAKAKDLTASSRGAFTVDIYDRTAASSGSAALLACVECANQSTAGCINDSTNGGKHVTARMVLEDLPPGEYTAIIRPTSGSDEPRFRVLIRDLDYLPMPVELSNGLPACHNTRKGGNDADSFSVSDLPAKDANGDLIDYYLVLRRFNDEPLSEPMDFSLHIVNDEPPDASTTPAVCSGTASGFGEITQTFVPGLTYYAVVKGVEADDQGWYQLTMGKAYSSGSTGTGLQESDDVPNVSWSGNFGGTPVASVANALNNRAIRVIGINPSTDTTVTTQLGTIATATDATRLDGTGLVASGVTPESISAQVVQLVEELSFSTQSDVSVQLLKWPDDPNDDADDFDFYVTAIDSAGDGAADGCTDVSDTIADSIDRPDTHINCTAGATPKFQVTFGNPEDAPVDCKCDVDPTHADCAGWDGTTCIGYQMTLQLVADNQYIVEQIPVYIIPRDVAAEPNYTQYDPSGTYWQNFGSPNCTAVESTDWHDLEWDLMLPSANPGASVTWSVCTSDDPLTATSTCNFTTVATVTTDGTSCATSAECPNGMCSHGQCQYVRGPVCAIDTDCGNGACIGGQCMWTTLPLDVGELLTPEENGLSFMRVQATMASSTDLRAAPEIYDWTVRYSCVSTE